MIQLKDRRSCCMFAYPYPEHNSPNRIILKISLRFNFKEGKKKPIYF